MPRKPQIVQTPAELTATLPSDDDEDIQLAAEPAPVVSAGKPVAKPEMAVEAPPPKKQRRPYTMTEEHREALRQRLQVAQARKMELAEERRKVKEEQERALELKKQAKILEEAEKIKRREARVLKSLEVKALPEVKPKKKKKVILYVSDSEGDEEDDEEEEEEEIVVKPKPKPQRVRAAPPRPARVQRSQAIEYEAPVQPRPVVQPIRWNIV